MLAQEIHKIENENRILREALEELKEKMEHNEIQKPKGCQYCKNYIQHYIKDGAAHTLPYVPIYAGHCTCGVPIKEGRKRRPKPDDTCPYFELGTHNMKHLV